MTTVGKPLSDQAPAAAPATPAPPATTAAAVARPEVPRLSGRDGRMEAAKAAVRRRKRNRTLTVRALQVLLVVVILGSWEIMSRTGVLPDAKLFYGRPSGVVQFLVDNRSHLWTDALATIYAAFLGFAIGASSGVLVGLLFGRWPLLERTFDPVMNVLASLPRLALAPLFLLWFGISDTSKVLLAVSIVFFVVLFNTIAGVRSVDSELRTVASLLGASPRQVFIKVVLPGAVPVIFAALRLALMFSMLGVVGSEMIAAKSGLGVDVVTYGQNLEPNGVFAVLAILAVVAALFSAALRTIESRLLRWMPEHS